jgi:hypothetical protein
MPLYTRTGWLPLLPGLLRQCVPGEILVSWRPSDGGLTDAEEAAKVFASTNSQAAWVDWPVRTTLGLESVAGYFAGGSDTLNRISIGIQTFESKTNSNEILSVAALPPVSGVITGVPGWTAEHRETVEGNPLFDELFMYTTRPQDARASALARVARDLALTMSEGVALTLFATSEGSGEKPPFTDNGVVVEAAASEVGDADPLSDVWIEAIASFLPRSQHERDVLATKMMRKDKGLGVMVEQWRDYLAADAERVERRRREIIAEIDIEEADDEDL